MRKIRIKSKASSANLGIGFDFLGMGLNIYNVTEFTENEEFKFINFDDVENNLIYDSYVYFFKKFNINPVPVIIKQVKRNIPLARGLGSSASAIVTGVLAANYFSQKKLNELELLNIMVEIEGHPDNVCASYFGGLCSTIGKDGHVKMITRSRLSPIYKFYLFIPSYEVKTSDARKILKESLTYQDYVHNASRAFLAKDAFESGAIYQLKECLDDVIHEPYRKTLIKEYDEYFNKYKYSSTIVKISGSGSTLLFITDEDLNDDNLIKVKVDEKITEVEELQ